jgi:glutaconate CoA-transferase subunit A
VPFLPIAGFAGSDLPSSLGLKTVRNPYGEEELVAIPRLRPDWAVVHVPVADARGNARIYGSPFWDRLMARAARRVLLTAERIVASEELARQPELTAIPEILVEAVVVAPGGAWPGSCYPEYDVDYDAVEAYLATARDASGLRRHLEAARERSHGANGRAGAARSLGTAGQATTVERGCETSGRAGRPPEASVGRASR